MPRSSELLECGESLLLRWVSPGVGLTIALWLAANFRITLEGSGLALGLILQRRVVKLLPGGDEPEAVPA